MRFSIHSALFSSCIDFGRFSGVFTIAGILFFLATELSEVQCRAALTKNLVKSGKSGTNSAPSSSGGQIVEWNKKWPGGIVYFEISPQFSEPQCQLILGAMKEISDKTCIKFKRRSGQPDYVTILQNTDEGCHSTIGHNSGKHLVSLQTDGCIRHGTVVHELLHILGFHHEHQRPDRDNFITIFWDNIKPVKKVQFEKLTAPATFLKNYPYDYGSIMHYGKTASFLAIIRSKPVIQPKMSAPKMGQRIAMSDLDVKKVKALYQCG